MFVCCWLTWIFFNSISGVIDERNKKKCVWIFYGKTYFTTAHFNICRKRFSEIAKSRIVDREFEWNENKVVYVIAYAAPQNLAYPLSRYTAYNHHIRRKQTRLFRLGENNLELTKPAYYKSTSSKYIFRALPAAFLLNLNFNSQFNPIHAIWNEIPTTVLRNATQNQQPPSQFTREKKTISDFWVFASLNYGLIFYAIST